MTMARRTKAEKRAAYRATHTSASGTAELPRKKFYRQRAHANPFSDHALTYPPSPLQMDWSLHFPQYCTSTGLKQPVTVADVGCGFGGLLIALAPLLPDDLILGLEIRVQVTRFVHDRVLALRRRQQNLPENGQQQEQTHSPSENEQLHSAAQLLPPELDDSPSGTVDADHPPTITPTASYQNISALRTNTMKFLPNFFPRASLRLIFLCFPDPHFKQRKHKARIVSDALCAEYAYLLREGGMVYTITDVDELATWMAERFGRCELFERVVLPPDDDGDVAGTDGQAGHGQQQQDQRGQQQDEQEELKVLLRCIRDETEEAKKVTRNGGRKNVSVWRRRADPAWPGE